MWLVDKTGLDYREYSELLSTLYSITFRWNGDIPTDKNRASDGVLLREDYLDDVGRFDSFDSQLDMPCNVLEMLIALAIRIDDLVGVPGESHIDTWFQEMVTNLGLSAKTNPSAIKAIVTSWMSRQFDFTGAGQSKSLFGSGFCF